jgi:hypothetical protein
VIDEGAPALLSNLVVVLGLLSWIKAARLEDSKCTKIRQLLRHRGFALRMMGYSSMSVLEGEGLRNEILSKTHHSPYTVHSGSTKMYKDEEMSKLKYTT